MQNLRRQIFVAMSLMFVSLVSSSVYADDPGIPKPGPKCSVICTCQSSCHAACNGAGIINSCGGFGVCRSVPACQTAGVPPLEPLTLASPPRSVSTAGDEPVAQDCASSPRPTRASSTRGAHP